MEMVNIIAMPGSIPAPNSGSFVEKNKKNISCQIGQADKKKHLKKPFIISVEIPI
jgi:hypothetical protein